MKPFWQLKLQNAASAMKTRNRFRFDKSCQKTQHKISSSKVTPITNLPKRSKTFATSFLRRNIIPTIKVLNDFLRQSSHPSSLRPSRPTNLPKVEMASRPWSTIQDMIYKQPFLGINTTEMRLNQKRQKQKSEKGELIKSMQPGEGELLCNGLNRFEDLWLEANTLAATHPGTKLTTAMPVGRCWGLIRKRTKQIVAFFSFVGISSNSQLSRFLITTLSRSKWKEWTPQDGLWRAQFWSFHFPMSLEQAAFSIQWRQEPTVP